jgi:hypothetical protein
MLTVCAGWSEAVGEHEQGDAMIWVVGVGVGGELV